MILPIVLLGEPVLRVKCKPVTTVTSELHELAANMIETMHGARGVGLAAPQVGVPIQLAVIEVPPGDQSVTTLRLNGEKKTLADIMPLIFINPQLDLHKAKVVGEEGCLSIPLLRENVRRSAVVKVTYQTLDGVSQTLEADGLLSRALQHEIDHLNGILFIDRISVAAKVGLKRKIQRLREEWEEEGGEPEED